MRGQMKKTSFKEGQIVSLGEINKLKNSLFDIAWGESLEDNGSYSRCNSSKYNRMKKYFLKNVKFKIVSI